MYSETPVHEITTASPAAAVLDGAFSVAGHSADDAEFDVPAAAVAPLGSPTKPHAKRPADPRTGEDRRRSQRRAETCDAFLASPTSTDPSERWEVRGVNLSRHGIGFHSPVWLPPRAYFAIDFGLGNQRVCCEIRVNNCRALDDGSFEVGAEFC